MVKEIEKLLQEMNGYNKGPENDHIATGAVKLSEKMLLRQKRFNLSILHWCAVLKYMVWYERKKIRLKGKNDRAINLFLHLYKLFTKIINKRLENKSISYQPIEKTVIRLVFGIN